MTDDDRKHFGEQLKHFGQIHKTTVDKPLVQAYWEDLKGMSRNEFDIACLKLRQSSEWFPRPAHFTIAVKRFWT